VRISLCKAEGRTEEEVVAFDFNILNWGFLEINEENLKKQVSRCFA
jgi:hypothetical protein